MIYWWYDEINDAIMCMFIIVASICEILEQFRNLGICSYMLWNGFMVWWWFNVVLMFMSTILVCICKLDEQLEVGLNIYTCYEMGLDMKDEPYANW